MRVALLLAVVGSILIVTGLALADGGGVLACSDEAEEKCVDPAANPCGTDGTCIDWDSPDDQFCEYMGTTKKVLKLDRALSANWQTCRDLPGSPGYVCGESEQICALENWYVNAACTQQCGLRIVKRCKADGAPSCPL